MAWLEALLLGVVQGVTEFLPVSSSAHLVFARSLMPDLHTPGILFEVLVHLGTLSAVLYFFRKEVRALFLSLLPGGERRDRLLVLFILAASVPTAFAGFLLKDYIETLFKSVASAAAMLLVTGVLLWVSELFSSPRFSRYNMGWLRAVGVGVFQSIALAPGISRSGATIAGGKLLGIGGEDAAVFSFLISIPAILGATLLEARHVAAVDAKALYLCLAGTLAAFFSGLLSLGLLMAVVRKSRLRWFAVYCFAAGLSILALGVN